MAEWYDLMADLGSDTKISTPVLNNNELPETLTVPANNADEINLEDFYSYQGYDDNGRKIVSDDVTDNSDTQNDNMPWFSEQFPSKFNSEPDISTLPTVYNELVDVHMYPNNSEEFHTSNKSYHQVTQGNNDNNDNNATAVSTTKHNKISIPVIPKIDFVINQHQESVRRGNKPISSLQSQMMSNPYFADIAVPSIPSPTVGTNPPRFAYGSEITIRELYPMPPGKHDDDKNSAAASRFNSNVNNVRTKTLARPPELRPTTTTSNTTTGGVETAPLKGRKHLVYAPSKVNVWGDDDEDVDRKAVELLNKLETSKKKATPRRTRYDDDSEDSDVEATKTSAIAVTTHMPLVSTSVTKQATNHAQSLAAGVFTLGGIVTSKQANKVLYQAGEAILFVKDQAMKNVTQYMASNMYICSFIGCVHESLYYVTDRVSTATDMYLNTLTSDDPEKRHLHRIKNSTKWQNILLRYSMASLTWKQRQLLEETRDGGTLDQMDLNSLMRESMRGGGRGQSNITEGKSRLMRIADEFYYITTANDTHSYVGDTNTTHYVASNVATTAAPAGTKTTALNAQKVRNQSVDVPDDLTMEGNVLVVKQKASFATSVTQDGETVDIIGGDAAQSTVAMEFIQSNIHAWLENEAGEGDEDAQYALAKFFTAPCFSENNCCYQCKRVFGITLFRHHCRFCGQSVCEDHSKDKRCIFRFGMIQPVRVCGRCKVNIDEIYRRDTLIWKESRVQAYLNNRLIPYFNPTVDRGIDKALRIADYSLIVAKNTLALNFPTKVVLETIDILKRYGLSGFAGLLLRQDFLESVETLKRISGMDTMFSMSLHELTACIYYKLAIDRGLRGCNPEGERIAHAPHVSASNCNLDRAFGVHTTNAYSSYCESASGVGGNRGGVREVDSPSCTGEDFDCDAAKPEDIDKAIRFAPLALKIVYEVNPVDCQRLARTQGWDMIFNNAENNPIPEQPVYALFANELPTRVMRDVSDNNNNEYMSSIRTGGGGGEGHQRTTSSSTSRQNDTKGESKPYGGRVPKQIMRKEAVLAICGTKTIQDVVTDIRAAPQEFPPSTDEINMALNGECFIDNTKTSFHSMKRKPDGTDGRDSPVSESESMHNSPDTQGKAAQWEWLNVSHTSTYACGGFSRAAINVLRDVGPSLLALYRQGYTVTIVGHSLGGGVAALLTYMLRTAIPNIYCITYGCPSCVDAVTADLLRNFVLSVINHDDVISRITPQSIRALMSELMLFREQVFKHIQQDWLDVISRAYSLWSPRWRQTHSNQDLSGVSSEAFKALTKQPVRAAIMSAAVKDVNSPLPRDSDDINMEMVEQEVLPDLWVPGRIIHIYLHKGQYHASEVSRTFPDIRKIEVQGNMFEDHRSKNMLDALLEVRSVRRAVNTPPDWIPFNLANVCYCCSNSFTWHSTFRGAAQEYRDRYNCKHCGNVVCGPCSMQRRAIPKYGLLFLERICDHCLYKGDFALVQ